MDANHCEKCGNTHGLLCLGKSALTKQPISAEAAKVMWLLGEVMGRG